MTESGQNQSLGSPLDLSADCSETMASLRRAGADKFDPVGFNYLEVLASRRNAHHAGVQRLLERKLAHALATFRQRFEVAQGDAKLSMDSLQSQYPQACVELQRLFSIGDFSGLNRFIATLKAGDYRMSLGDLARQMQQHSPKSADSRLDGSLNAAIGWRSDLKATQYFRTTWSKISVDKRVTQALMQAPKNPGPMNSHMLVLRSLALMRDISPDYLNRFSAYVDTLLCLDQCGTDKPANPPNPRLAKITKGNKSSRSIQKPL